MNAGTKYLMDSVSGLVMEVANLRTLNEALTSQLEAAKNRAASTLGNAAPVADPLAPPGELLYDQHGPSQPA